MFKSLERFANSRFPGYKPEPGETEIGRVSVQTDRPSGFAVLESYNFALTDRRLLLIEAHFHLALVIIPFVLMIVLHLQPIYLPLLLIVMALLVRIFRIRTTASQLRDDLISCVHEPSAGVSVKPRILLGFRDGTHWTLKNPNRGPGRLDSIVGLLRKGGLAVEGFETTGAIHRAPSVAGNGSAGT